MSQLKDSAAHTKDALGAKFDKNKAEAKDALHSGHDPKLVAEKEAAKAQEKASKGAAQNHYEVVSFCSWRNVLWVDACHGTSSLVILTELD